jgi:hypothetical protein
LRSDCRKTILGRALDGSLSYTWTGWRVFAGDWFRKIFGSRGDALVSSTRQTNFNDAVSKPGLSNATWPMIVLTSLSLSIGWGIRGNFGHEFGAMIPGALAAMAVVLTSARDDWHRRVAYFAMFGAIGWSFGGSMSYMQVLAYTHSGHSSSVMYGFACLFVIGFLWAFLGGAGTALPAFLDRKRLTELCEPMAAVLLAWGLDETVLEPWLSARHFTLNWFDTDWIGALSAIVAVMALALVRRRLDRGSELILHLALGWWAAFLVLVVGLGIRMTPPRGDNWSGCVGMAIGLLVYCWRHQLFGVAYAALVTGFLGGIGFAAASMLKLVEVTSGYQTNWHSILEQTTGLFNGLALAVAMIPLARTAPRPVEEPQVRRWTDVFAVGFVVLLITYLNLRKSPGTWVSDHAVPALLHDIPVRTWFDLAYGFLAIAILVPLMGHLRRPLPLIPVDPVGRAQWLYLVFLWWMVVGNFERALTNFQAQRLVTEGVIFANAAFCTGFLLVTAQGPDATRPGSPWRHPPLGRVVTVGLLAAIVSIVVDWGIVRAIYGDRFAGHASLHIRFGPNATTGQKPRR